MDSRFRSPVVGVVDAWKDSEPSMGAPLSRGALWLPCTSPNQPPIGQRCWGFHLARGGVDPGEHRFRIRGVGVVEIRRLYDPGMGPYAPRVRWLYAL